MLTKWSTERNSNVTQQQLHLTQQGNEKNKYSAKLPYATAIRQIFGIFVVIALLQELEQTDEFSTPMVLFVYFTPLYFPRWKGKQTYDVNRKTQRQTTFVDNEVVAHLAYDSNMNPISLTITKSTFSLELGPFILQTRMMVSTPSFGTQPLGPLPGGQWGHGTENNLHS